MFCYDQNGVWRIVGSVDFLVCIRLSVACFSVILNESPLFVDDTLLFREASEDKFSHLCWFLMWFEALLGLKINLEENEIIPIDSVDDEEVLVDELG